MIPNNAPIVIGGTGGSGTRIFMRVVRSVGVDMGTLLNESEDSISLTEFCDQWINKLPTGDVANLTASEQAAIDAEFLQCIEKHCAYMSTGTQWGWKYPRTIYLLPFVYRHFPQMRFVHVIRDGRDMAFSVNQNQLYKHGAAVLGRDIDPTSPQDSFELWTKVNNAAADFGMQVLKERYIRIQFEELVMRPLPTMQKLWNFLQLSPGSQLPELEIKVPATIGRWQQADQEVVSKLLLKGSQSLQRFGYLEDKNTVNKVSFILEKLLKVFGFQQ